MSPGGTGTAKGKRDRQNERIAIIGGGPAGLSAAHYLKAQGYRDVSVFEKLGRVGGLCHTVTQGYRSFDLGGNYVTPDYRETLKIADSIGMETIKAHKYLGAKEVDGEVQYFNIYDWLHEDPDEPGKPLGLFKMIRLILRYGWIRFKLRKIIDRPTMAAVSEHPDLCIPFSDWLEANGLSKLRRMFEVPITMMGYGFLDQIAAPYALKYISLGTYRAMLMRGLPVLGNYAYWPRRFEHGFQRMWERLSWGLNVRLEVSIEKIIRTGDPERPICMQFSHNDEIGHQELPRTGELWFDRIILACPLTPAVLTTFLDLTPAEEALFEKVTTYSFCHFCLECEDQHGAPYQLPAPVVCIFPFDRNTIGQPWAAVQYWGKESPMLQLYSRVSLEGDGDGEVDRQDVVKMALQRLATMGAYPAGKLDAKDARWTFYTDWPYFGHVDADEIKAGFFKDLEGLQGIEGTYYVGGVTNFELIEPIVQHSKYIVETHFPRV